MKFKIFLLKHYNFALGCEVFAYDHTVNYFPPTKHTNLHFIKTGIGNTNTMAFSGGERRKVRTLDTLLRENGHTGKVISYLKVCDISSIPLSRTNIEDSEDRKS